MSGKETEQSQTWEFWFGFGFAIGPYQGCSGHLPGSEFRAHSWWAKETGIKP